jgi:hypothetical protein
VNVIFSSLISLYQNNILTCSQEIKFSKLGMAEQLCMGEGLNRSVGVLSGTVELLCLWEGNVMVSGLKLAAIKTNS